MSAVFARQPSIRPGTSLVPHQPRQRAALNCSSPPRFARRPPPASSDQRCAFSHRRAPLGRVGSLRLEAHMRASVCSSRIGPLGPQRVAPHSALFFCTPAQFRIGCAQVYHAPDILRNENAFGLRRAFGPAAHGLGNLHGPPRQRIRLSSPARLRATFVISS